MNVQESCTITSPDNKLEECAKFIIDDRTKAFVLSDVMVVDREYTFSCWIRSDEDGSVITQGKTFSSTIDWQRLVYTFTASDIDLSIVFSSVGTYYIYHPQLEIGNKATDWSPAPEDHTEEMDTRFSIEAGKIEAQFTVINESINELGERIQERYSKYITEDENGITITDSDDVYSIQVDNVEGVTIRKDGEIRSQLKDDNFYTGNMVVKTTERAQFGNFAFIPRSDGSISFLKVGD